MGPFTPFPDLDAVLAALVDGARSVLGPRFAAAYLQGSFALGDGDACSDADFIIVTEGDTGAAGESALNAMHTALHGRPETWAQHLEGSYAPAAIFRGMAGTPIDPPGVPRDPAWRDPQTGQPPRVYPFLFLNNGDRTLIRSQHDNTLVVRQVTREHGITLAGPPPAALIDEVDPEALRAEMRDIATSFGGEILSGAETIDALWLQGFTVLFFARVLHALETGRVASKPAAVRWASHALAPRWRGLIEDAWTQRARYPRGRGAPAAHRALAPERVAETIAFVRYALGLPALAGGA
ncbi:MAG: DUF4111 domain-containing protein [Dehalococcoidia bacterium]|nr:DUF4111 domain-containing protein [Dehalococcoidia bacterium]